MAQGLFTGLPFFWGPYCVLPFDKKLRMKLIVANVLLSQTFTFAERGLGWWEREKKKIFMRMSRVYKTMSGIKHLRCSLGWPLGYKIMRIAQQQFRLMNANGLDLSIWEGLLDFVKSSLWNRLTFCPESVHVSYSSWVLGTRVHTKRANHLGLWWNLTRMLQFTKWSKVEQQDFSWKELRCGIRSTPGTAGNTRTSCLHTCLNIVIAWLDFHKEMC